MTNVIALTHVYYECTKARDKNCPCGYINETELIKQLQKLVDDIDLNETFIRKEVEVEVTRYKKFQKYLLGESSDISITDVDIRGYVKFLLREGTLEEKREILSCFKSQIFLKKKQIYLG